MLGGGFGRRPRTGYVTQAIQIAKQVPGTPIKMIWSREEDMLDLFRWGRIFG
jgi:isoquinoline 1-oxidoreductase subunit beta